METITFTFEQRELLCSIINVFGTGEHPYADDKTLPYFTKEYVKGLVIEILESEKYIETLANLTDDGVKYLAEIKELLN